MFYQKKKKKYSENVLMGWVLTNISVPVSSEILAQIIARIIFTELLHICGGWFSSNLLKLFLTL